MSPNTRMYSAYFIARSTRQRIGRALAIISVPACLLAISEAVLASAASACEFRNAVIRSASEPATQLYEFKISLNQPDYENLEATKQHLTFATVLTRLLIAESASRSRSECSVIASTSLFPNIRVGVRSSLKLDDCVGLIHDIASEFTPSNELVERTASSIASAKKFAAKNPAGFMTEAGNILNKALKNIYEENSAMHALVSVGPNDFEFLSVSLFNDWLRNQRAKETMSLVPLVICESDQELANTRPSNGNMPYSNVLPPQTISLRVGKVASANPQRLSYLVIIGGDRRPENSPLRSTATREFCEREHTFRLEPDGKAFSARTHCLTEIIHNADTWVALFCDPKDCGSAELAEKVAMAVANDPLVLALTAENALNGQSQGPYIIKIVDGDGQ
jgi:hypothetical protein